MTRRTRESLLVIGGAIGISIVMWALAYLLIRSLLEVLR